jgi:hypothetical protein
MPLLLVNENFPAPSTQVLRAAGLDVLAIGESHPSMLPPPPAVLLLRERSYRVNEPAQWVLPLVALPAEVEGFFCIVTRHRLRKRPLLATVPLPGRDA